jgi:hypothetical protein
VIVALLNEQIDTLLTRAETAEHENADLRRQLERATKQREALKKALRKIGFLRNIYQTSAQTRSIYIDQGNYIQRRLEAERDAATKSRNAIAQQL